MPIRPENRARYPKDWKAIRAAILTRAGHCCEGTPQFPDCRAVNYEPHPRTGSRVILTIAHMDQTPENNNPANLRALCQKCHNAWDAPHRQLNASITRSEKNGQPDLLGRPNAPLTGGRENG